jgi:alpha-N-arabinofuranosidase
MRQHAMKNATLTVDKDFKIGDIDPRLFGAFLEHMGRAVYSGIYEPGHPTADAEGFRTDVLDFVRELNVPVVRYPGGNFVSGYNWEDGVGPKEQRPRRQELAWKSIETNQVGTNEFIDWCRKAGTEPMMAVNLGTRGPDAARSLVEYCNHPCGTAWSDLRRAHGYAAPYGIKLWCLGNEMDGDWQMGCKTAEEYGRVATEAAKLMKWADDSIELVACGSSSAGMPSFAAWEATVLEHTYHHVDYLSLHTYIGKRGDDRADFFGQSVGMEEFIRSVASICDYVKAKKRARKTMYLAFDEWNISYHAHESDAKQAPWLEAPPIAEERYTLEDALVVGSMLLALLRCADRVKIGCIAQLVNILGPIMTVRGGAAWRQTIFYPYLHASLYGHGTALQFVMESPVFETKRFGAVPVVDAAVTRDEATGTVTLFAVNRDPESRPVALNVDLRSFGTLSFLDHTMLSHPDPLAANTANEPNKVIPTTGERISIEDGKFTISLAPLSWNVLRYKAG